MWGVRREEWAFQGDTSTWTAFCSGFITYSEITFEYKGEGAEMLCDEPQAASGCWGSPLPLVLTVFLTSGFCVSAPEVSSVAFCLLEMSSHEYLKKKKKTNNTQINTLPVGASAPCLCHY